MEKLSEFSDRALLELILTNQIMIIREIRDLQKDKARGQYWITFKKLLQNNQEIIPQIDLYLKDKQIADDNYNPDQQGEG
jgi:hypothetical protein